eukprot:10874837-Karenia_brevis.AAC.1
MGNNAMVLPPTAKNELILQTQRKQKSMRPAQCHCSMLYASRKAFWDPNKQSAPPHSKQLQCI